MPKTKRSPREQKILAEITRQIFADKETQRLWKALIKAVMFTYPAYRKCMELDDGSSQEKRD